MTPPARAPSAAELAEARYLATPRAIRDRAETVYGLGLRGALEHFAIDEARLPALVARVVDVTRAAYPDVRAIPDHTRFRHFGVGGVDRVAQMDRRLGNVSAEERLRVKIELAISSVLLDAGAGDRWSFHEAGVDGGTYARSEGLAVASYHLYASGALSDDRANAPFRADAGALARFSEEALAKAFQVTVDNPLVGLSGRVEIVRRLGEAVGQRSDVFAGRRLGDLGPYLASQARDGALPATAVLGAVIDGLGQIWPGREVCGGKSLGDVWTHPAVGRVPFHKLSQWLTYSVCEPLEQSGLRVTGKNELTGLAEYRNGGLFVDGGVLVPKHAGVLAEIHDVSSPVIVEWRALTIALLDRTAAEMRSQLALSADELPLAAVLEGGTWRTGRVLAKERRPDGGPPIRVNSDGTVF